MLVSPGTKRQSAGLTLNMLSMKPNGAYERIRPSPSNIEMAFIVNDQIWSVLGWSSPLKF